MCDYFETFQEEDMIAENNYIVCSPLLSEKERQATVKMEEENPEGKILFALSAYNFSCDNRIEWNPLN